MKSLSKSAATNAFLSSFLFAFVLISNQKTGTRTAIESKTGFAWNFKSASCFHDDIIRQKFCYELLTYAAKHKSSLKQIKVYIGIDTETPTGF